MVTVPGFLLRRLYVKGSLKNTAAGFEFELMNRLGSGYAHKLWPITVDGEAAPTDKTFFAVESEETAFNVVSKEATLHPGNEQENHDSRRRCGSGARSVENRHGVRRARPRDPLSSISPTW